MEKFDIRSAKLVSIIGLILFIFIMVVANAYQYLPAEDSVKPDVNNEVSQPVENTNDYEEVKETQPANENLKEEEAISEKTVKENISADEKITPLENISDDTGSITNNVEKGFEEVVAEAKQLKDQKQLVKSIETYQKAIQLAETNKQKAECYEKISTIYALTKKYGTALSFAQKAYNIAPSTTREILLARLYYKTGNTDKASDRINNVLRRDFNQDN